MYKEIVSHKSQPCNKRLWNPISSLGGTLWFLWSKTNCFSIHALLCITKWIQEQPIISPQNCYGLMPKLDKCILCFGLFNNSNELVHLLLHSMKVSNVSQVLPISIATKEFRYSYSAIYYTAYNRNNYSQVANNKVQFNPPDTWIALFLKRFFQSESAI